MSIIRALEEFLSQVAEQQAAQQRAAQQPAQQPERRTPVRPASARQPSSPAVDAEIVEVEPLREDVSRHVAEHLDTSDIRQHTAQLGAEVALADDKLDARLHDKFDHRLRRLKQAARPAPAPSALASFEVAVAALPASEMIQWLRNPANLRQAVVLSEILQRPEHRW
jgi:hypothetical protein